MSSPLSSSRDNSPLSSVPSSPSSSLDDPNHSHLHHHQEELDEHHEELDEHQYHLGPRRGDLALEDEEPSSDGDKHYAFNGDSRGHSPQPPLIVLSSSDESDTHAQVDGSPPAHSSPPNDAWNESSSDESLSQSRWSMGNVDDRDVPLSDEESYSDSPSESDELEGSDGNDSEESDPILGESFERYQLHRDIDTRGSEEESQESSSFGDGIGDYKIRNDDEDSSGSKNESQESSSSFDNIQLHEVPIVRDEFWKRSEEETDDYEEKDKQGDYDYDDEDEDDHDEEEEEEEDDDDDEDEGREEDEEDEEEVESLGECDDGDDADLVSVDPNTLLQDVLSCEKKIKASVMEYQLMMNDEHTTSREEVDEKERLFLDLLGCSSVLKKHILQYQKMVECVPPMEASGAPIHGSDPVMSTLGEHEGSASYQLSREDDHIQHGDGNETDDSEFSPSSVERQSSDDEPATPEEDVAPKPRYSADEISLMKEFFIDHPELEWSFDEGGPSSADVQDACEKLAVVIPRMERVCASQDEPLALNALILKKEQQLDSLQLLLKERMNRANILRARIEVYQSLVEVFQLANVGARTLLRPKRALSPHGDSTPRAPKQARRTRMV